jgi:hypothetical protein
MPKYTLSAILFFLLGVAVALIAPVVLQLVSAAEDGGGGPTIEQVRSLATLLTHRIDVADVQRTTLSGYSGGVSAALIVKGDVQVGVDLGRATFESIDHAARRATLVLPLPTIGTPRVDHARTRLWAITHQGLWQVVPGDRAAVSVVNHAYEQAQRMIGTAADRPELIERSRQQAEGVLKTFFAALGWDVTVRWADRNNPTSTSTPREGDHHE